MTGLLGVKWGVESVDWDGKEVGMIIVEEISRGYILGAKFEVWLCFSGRN